MEDEYVGEDEMAENIDNTGKISLRPKALGNQRRFSRIIVGSEKGLSKDNGLKIKWGINFA
jgi:hypothetical protein